MRRFSAARVDLGCPEAGVPRTSTSRSTTWRWRRSPAVTARMLLDRGETPGPQRAAHAGSGIDALGGPLRRDRQPGVGDAAVVAGRRTGPGQAVAARAPADSTRPRAVVSVRAAAPLLAVAGNVPFAFSAWTIRLADAAAADGGDRPGDERARASRAAAADGPRGAGNPADPADRASAAHRYRDGQLRRPVRLRHHRRLRTPRPISMRCGIERGVARWAVAASARRRQRWIVPGWVPLVGWRRACSDEARICAEAMCLQSLAARATERWRGEENAANGQQPIMTRSNSRSAGTSPRG